MEKRKTREHQDTKIYPALDHLAKTRPIGKLVDKGHMYLGVALIEGAKVDVEADVETCGNHYLRILVNEGDCLRYTTRLTQVGSTWFVANERDFLEIWSEKLKRVQRVILRDVGFQRPQEFATWLYNALYNKPKVLEAFPAYKPETIREPLWSSP